MLKQREQVVKGTISSEHVVQLFDGPESRGEAVASFLCKGLESGGSLLVVAKTSSVREIERALERTGVSMSALVDGKGMSILDAHTTLGRVLRNGSVDSRGFDASIADVVIRLAQGPGRLHIYGEMVEILAEEGNFPAAIELEDLWNHLSAVVLFSLLCGYSSAHFAASDSGRALQHICDRHTRVHQNNADILGNWLLGVQRATKTPPADVSVAAAPNT